MRTDRASDTLAFFQGEVERLQGALEAQSQKIAEFKTANVSALPDSLDSRRAQQEREEQRPRPAARGIGAEEPARHRGLGVRAHRAASDAVPLSPEEEELQALKSQLLQQQAIYRSNSPQIRVLQTRIAALESLVAEQRAARSVPGPDGEAAKPLSARPRARADRRAAEVHRRGEGHDRADARRARRLDPGDAAGTR